MHFTVGHCMGVSSFHGSHCVCAIQLRDKMFRILRATSSSLTRRKVQVNINGLILIVWFDPVCSTYVYMSTLLVLAHWLMTDHRENTAKQTSLGLTFGTVHNCLQKNATKSCSPHPRPQAPHGATRRFEVYETANLYSLLSPVLLLPHQTSYWM